MRLQGTYLVSLDDNEKRVVRTEIYLEAMGTIGALLTDIRFWIRLPGYEDRIEVKYGEGRELSPFYTEEPDIYHTRHCDCGIEVVDLVHQFGQYWRRGHIQFCPACHTNAFHKSDGGGHCLNCDHSIGSTQVSGSEERSMTE